MALAGLTGGRLSLAAKIPPAHDQINPLSAAAAEQLKLKDAMALAIEDGRPLHDVLMSARGWPEISYDGRLLVSHQDALLMGGKVQAMPGFADHVFFRDNSVCKTCEERTCIAMCSGQAITLGPDNAPAFEREKCIHCGACLWNCAHSLADETANIEFHAGSGGLHSAEN
jgi:electron-transferring-flavoprotein dehydrogenase